ncbi:MAG: M56 family metallopeptidase, partial [Verrucomicrobia bacterium]|nr:M56 family metallopeptidase [Verrucomicrobiota bacterium]
LVIQALGEHLEPCWRCRLWMLVIVRLAWPVSLPSPVSLFNWVGTPGVLDSRGTEPAWNDAELVLWTRILENPWIQGIWALIVCLLLGRLMLSALWAWWIERTARPLDSWQTWWILQNCKTASGCTTPLAILESRRIQSPCVLGLFRPRLVLPRGLIADLDSEELRLVFLHELAHLNRRDLVLNWLLAAVEIIHWFNPVAWLVTRQLRADREEDCDARALETRPDAGRVYGEVILKLLDRVAVPDSGAAPAMTSRMLGSGDSELQPLLHRIHAIRRFRPGSRRRLVGFCSWLAVALIGLTDAEPIRRGDLALDPASESLMVRQAGPIHMG